MGLLAKFGFEGKDGEPARLEFAGFVGNSGGWIAFGAWADGLNPKKYERVVEIWEHSSVGDLDGFERELSAALKKEGKGLDDAGREVATALLNIVKQRGDAEALGIFDEFVEA